MSRSKFDACMICDEVPCVCGKTRRAPVAKKSQPQVEGDPASPVTIGPTKAQLSMRAAIVEQNRAEMHRKFTTPKPHRIPRNVDNDQVILHEALRALGDALHPEEQERYRVVLGAVPSLDERAAAWRLRHAYGD